MNKSLIFGLFGLSICCLILIVSVPDAECKKRVVKVTKAPVSTTSTVKSGKTKLEGSETTTKRPNDVVENKKGDKKDGKKDDNKDKKDVENNDKKGDKKDDKKGDKKGDKKDDKNERKKTVDTALNEKSMDLQSKVRKHFDEYINFVGENIANQDVYTDILSFYRNIRSKISRLVHTRDEQTQRPIRTKWPFSFTQ